MQSFLIVALLYRCFPNCGATNFTTFASQQVTFCQSESLEVSRRHTDRGQISYVDSVPLYSLISNIWLWNTDVFLSIQHLSKLH